jgi:hypothetical protein
VSPVTCNRQTSSAAPQAHERKSDPQEKRGSGCGKEYPARVMYDETGSSRAADHAWSGASDRFRNLTPCGLCAGGNSGRARRADCSVRRGRLRLHQCKLRGAHRRVAGQRNRRVGPRGPDGATCHPAARRQLVRASIHHAVKNKIICRRDHFVTTCMTPAWSRRRRKKGVRLRKRISAAG